MTGVWPLPTVWNLEFELGQCQALVLGQKVYLSELSLHPALIFLNNISWGSEYANLV